MRKSFAFVLVPLYASLVTPLQAAQVRGKVLAPDGQPVAGASIWTGEMGRLEFSDKDGTIKQLTSGADGSFAFDIADTAPAALVRVRAAGFALADSAFKPGDNQIRLQLPKTMRGDVKDIQNKPVENAVVRLFFAPGDERAFGEDLDRSPLNILSLLRWANTLPPIETRTDAEGKYKLDGARSGIVALKDPRFAAAIGFSGMGEPGEIAGNKLLTLIAKPGATLKGKLQTPDGKPLPDVFVLSGDFFGTDPVRTDADGVYTLPNVATSNINAAANAIQPFTMMIMGLSLTDDYIIPPLMIKKPLVVGQVNDAPEWKATRGIELTGVLIDAKTKAPVVGALVNAGMNQGKKSDAEGRFHVRIPPEQTFMSVTHPDYVNYWKNFPVPADAKTFDIGRVSLNRSLTLQGRLVDDKGQPAKTVQLTLTYSTPDMGQRGEGAVTNEDGKFTIKLPPGDIDVNLPEEWEAVTAGATKFKLDEKTGPIELKVRKTAQHLVKGRVVTPAGKAVAGATVTVTASRPRKPNEGTVNAEKTAETDAEGRFSLSYSGLINRPKVTKVVAEGYFFRKSSDAGLEGSKITTNEWPLPDTVVVEMLSTVSGRVLGTDGKPLENALVFSPDTEKFAPVKTDATGRFTVKSLPEGEVNLLAANGKNFARVAAKTGTEAELRLVQPGVLVASMQRQMFAQLLKDRSSALDDYWASIGSDKLLALTLQKDNALPSGEMDTTKADWNQAGTAVFYMLGQSARRDPAWLLQNGATLLSKAPHPKEGTERFAAEAAFATVAAMRGDAEAKALATKWLDFAITQRDKPGQNIENASRQFRLAGIAMALGHKNADGLLLGALTLADQAGKKTIVEQANNWGMLVGIGGPDAFRQIDDEWPIEARVNALAGAVRQVAPFDLARAKVLLDKMQTLKEDPAYKKRLEEIDQQSGRMPQQFDAAERMWRKAQIKSDFDAALKWTDDKKDFDWSLRVDMVRAAYQRKKFDVAARLMLPSMEQGWAPEGALAYFAALAQTFDKDLSTKLFERAEALTANQNEYDYQSRGDYGFYLAATNPAQARLWLENGWLKAKNLPKENQWVISATQSQLSSAMVALDPVRAVEMLGETETDDNRSQARARMAAYLLSDEASRAVLRAENDY